MPDGNIIELKDKVAREAVAGGTHFLGVTTTEITDGSTTSSISIGGETVTAANGDIVVYGNKEFIWATVDTKWHELGDVTNLGALALKDSASGTYTPAGSVDATFTGDSISYTPAGSISTPGITVTESSISIAEFDDAGSVTAGTAASASCTMPTLVFTPDASTENLSISWSDGSFSFTANTPTSVTLPTSKQTTVLNGATAALDAAPEFTGEAASLAVDGSISASFSGTQATITVS
jgi:hypothetical protein